MRQYDEPMFFDHLVSMPDGPVASVTLNLINGNAEHEVWARYVAPRSGYDIAVADGVDEKSLDELSQADRKILEDLWGKFGGFDRYALRDWTHVKENVPEWEDPNGSSFTIQYQTVFAHLGKKDAKSLERDIEEYRELARAFAASE
jgi:hypothetical protein